MLKPKQTKYLKQHRGRKTGRVYQQTIPHFGSILLQAQQAFWLTAQQLEATRRAIMKLLKKEGKLWITIFPHKPVTMRTVESRMGAGKGNVSHWVAVIKPGTIIFELSKVSPILLKKIMYVTNHKLPFKIKPLYTTLKNENTLIIN